MVSRVVSIIAVMGVVGALAVPTLLDSNDSALVGSEVKEQVRPFEDLHEAGTEYKEGSDGHAGKEFEEDDDEKGYYKSKSSKGNKGYKHFDSWHKKGGDKYGFESHSANGMKKGDGNGGEHYTHGGYDHHSAGSEKKSEKQTKNPKDHKAESTGYSYSNYESEGDDDAGHFTDGGDSSHYEGYDSGEYHGDGDHSGYTDDSGAFTDDGGSYEEDSGSYTEGEGEGEGTHAGYTNPGAMSYYIRHY